MNWMNSKEPEKPELVEPFSNGDTAMMFFGIVVGCVLLAGVLSLIFLFSGGSASSAVPISIIAFFIFLFGWIYSETSESKAINDGIMQRYADAMAQWEIDRQKQVDLALSIKESQRLSIASDIEYKKRKQLEAAKASEIEKKKVIYDKNMELWKKNFFGALDVMHKEYSNFSMNMAAEYGVSDETVIDKVFSEVYPRLPIASDWRMGCLRGLEKTDHRVAAIFKHLPLPNVYNMPPTPPS